MKKLVGIEFNTFSNVDDIGRVFTYEGRIMRGIFPKGLPIIKDLFASGLMDELYREEYIPKTDITEFYTDEFPMILEHEKIDFISYYSEWTLSMIKDAGLFVLKLESFLIQRGYRLKDCHPYNILFRSKGDCIYVDIGSIVPVADNRGSFLMEFDSFYTYPLSLYACYPDLVSKIIRRNHAWSIRELIVIENGVSSSILNKLKYMEARLLYGMTNKIALLNKIFLKHRKNLLTNQKFYAKGTWSDYQNLDNLYSVLECNFEEVFTNGRFERYKKILASVKKIAPKSVLEFGANSGLFAVAACKFCNSIDRYIATDFDNRAIDELYAFIKNNRFKYGYLLNINPLVMDLTGEYYHRNWKPLTKRIASDVVICMAITHHLILSQGINLRELFKYLKSLSRKYLIIEFMPLGLWGGNEVDSTVPEWYTLDWFIECMKEYFVIQSVEQLEKNRVLLIGTIAE